MARNLHWWDKGPKSVGLGVIIEHRSGGCWICLFWSFVEKVVFAKDILEDATDIEVAVKDLVATVTV